MARDRDVTVAAILEAEDRLTRTVTASARLVTEENRRVAASVSDVGVRTGETMGRVIQFDRALRTAGAGVRTMAYPLASELSPALGTTASRMASVIAGAAVMPTRMAAIGAGVVGLAGILIGTGVQALIKYREETERWNKAVRESDLSVLRSEAAKAAEEISGVTAELQRLRRERDSGAMDYRRRARMRDAEADLTDRERAALDRNAAADRAQRDHAQIEDARLFGGMSDAHFTERSRLRAGQLGLFDFRLAGHEQNFQEAMREAERLRLAGQPDAARRLVAAARERRQRDIGAAWSASQAGMSMHEDAAGAALPINTARSILGLERDTEALARGQRWADSFRESNALLEDPAAAPMRVEDAARIFAEEGRARTVELTRELVSLDRQRFEIIAQTPGLSMRERDALTEMVALERERLRFHEADLEIQEAETPGKERAARLRKGQIELEEGMARAQRALARQEREDPVSGMLAGIREIEQEWAGAGRAMTNVTRQTAQDIQNLLAGALRGEAMGKNFMRDFLNAMLRTGTDEIARQFTARLFGGVRSLLSGGAGSILSPFGLAESGAGAAPPINLSSAPAHVLAAYQQQGYQLVGGAGGQTYAVAPGATGTFLQTGTNPYDARYSDFGASGNLPGAADGSYFNSALGFAQAGLIAYGTYESTSRGTSSDPSGALVGASMAGLTAGSAAYTGAVAMGATAGLAGGAAAAAGVAGFVAFAAVMALYTVGEAEASARKRKLERRAARRRQAGEIVDQIADALNSDISVSEMLSRRIKLRGATGAVTRIEYRKGQGFRGVPEIREIDGPSVGGLLLALADVSGASELAAFIRQRGYSAEDVDVEHQLGFHDTRGWVNSARELAAAIGDVDGFLEGALAALQAAAERDDVVNAAPFGWVDRGYGVTRTDIAASAFLDRGIPEGPREIFTSRSYYRDVLGFDDALIARLISKINQSNAQRGAITDVSRTRFFQGF
jgi:hypothetical protein